MKKTETETAIAINNVFVFFGLNDILCAVAKLKCPKYTVTMASMRRPKKKKKEKQRTKRRTIMQSILLA